MWILDRKEGKWWWRENGRFISREENDCYWAAERDKREQLWVDILNKAFNENRS